MKSIEQVEDNRTNDQSQSRKGLALNVAVSRTWEVELKTRLRVRSLILQTSFKI